MIRYLLSDESWSRLKEIMFHFKIYNKLNLRKVVEGILYRMRTGIPWRDLPAEFGCWNSVYQQFNRWSKKSKLTNVFKYIVDDPDLEWVLIDGTIVKAHQHSTGSSTKSSEAIGKSVSGNSTCIHLATDAFGLPIDFIITEGQVHDVVIAPKLISQVPISSYVIAYKGYDDESLRNQIRNRGSIPICPRKSNSLIGNDDIDWNLYKHRHLVENCFARIKHFRGVATRYDKLKRNYKSTTALAFILMWLRI